MRAGILGSGLMGGKLETIFARAGHEVVFSYARSRGYSFTARIQKPGAIENSEMDVNPVTWTPIDQFVKMPLSNGVVSLAQARVCRSSFSPVTRLCPYLS